MKSEDGLLIDESTNTCLGYLFDFGGHGIFSPDGKVSITPDQAKRHNQMLAQAEIKGLDENCQIGQGGTFYFNSKKGITTWTGEKVADYTLSTNQKTVTFKRAGKVYRGRLQKDADCFNFRRVA